MLLAAASLGLDHDVHLCRLADVEGHDGAAVQRHAVEALAAHPEVLHLHHGPLEQVAAGLRVQDRVNNFVFFPNPGDWRYRNFVPKFRWISADFGEFNPKFFEF